MKVKITQSCLTFCELTPWTSSQGQITGEGSFFTSPEDLLNPGIELGSPALQVDLVPTELSGEPVSLKLNIQKTKIMASGPITSWKIDGEQWKQCQTLFWGAPKSLQMVTVVMKLKDAYSLEEKL